MYYKQPIGKYHVQVCTNLSCALVGADRIVDCLRKRLGIEVGETTPDGKFSLSEVECLASCGTAPMMQINDDYWENLTPRAHARDHRPAGAGHRPAPDDLLAERQRAPWTRCGLNSPSRPSRR